MSIKPFGGPFDYAGGAEPYEVELGVTGTRGITVTAVGFDLEDATVEIKIRGTEDYQAVTIDAGTGKSAVIAPEFVVVGVKISGLIGGSYKVGVFWG